MRSFFSFRCGFPLPIQFNRLTVNFNLKEYDAQANIIDNEQLKFIPDQYQMFTFNFNPKNDHVQRALEIVSVTLTYGFSDKIHIDFQWRNSLQPSNSSQGPNLVPKWRIKDGRVLWENLPVQRKTKSGFDSNSCKEFVTNCATFSLIMRPSEIQLNVEHQLPVLLYESYPMKIRIKNCESIEIHTAT